MFFILINPENDGEFVIGSKDDQNELASLQIMDALEQGKQVKIKCVAFEVIES